MLYNANETNTANNSTVTATQVVRVVKEQLTSPTIIGGDGNDVIKIEQHLQNTIVTVNNLSKVFENDAFDHLFIDGGLGNDRIFVTNDQVDIRLQVTGGGGADIIIGGNANDELSGGLGRDKLFGGKGDDLMIGGADNDYLGGEGGYDTMIGAGGNDRLADVVGRDWFIGGNGNDTIIARDLTPNGSNDPDTVSGNAGTDKAQIDSALLCGHQQQHRRTHSVGQMVRMPMSRSRGGASRPDDVCKDRLSFPSPGPALPPSRPGRL